MFRTSKTQQYYRYQGSLTTPSCSEDESWYVSTNIQQLSQEQLDQFQELFHGNNARPIQPINQRRLLLKQTED